MHDHLTLRTPLVVVTGVDPDAMDRTLVSLGWDLPQAVTVRHRIDPEAQVLTRVVSDAGGLLENHATPLEHACVSCALREDVVPTLERLATDGRWHTVVACLPAGAEADQLSTILTRDARLARRIRLATVVAAVGDDAEETLLGDSLLVERGAHTGPDDVRGTGEVACAQVELADVVVASSPDPVAVPLLGALARPDASVVVGTADLDGATLLAGRHAHRAAQEWCLAQGGSPPRLGAGPAWRVELTSSRPFHPERLVDRIGTLGGGRFRSRGCFWVPTRPDRLNHWDGAGGQLSIGTHGPWGGAKPRTRLLVTGVGEPPAHLPDAFEQILLTRAEAARDRRTWRTIEDGLEPWLGDIREVA